MAITLLQPFNFDSSKDYTFANVTATANIIASNANLGNAATANYFIGNGAYLTGLPASYANSNVAAYLPTFTGELKAGNANLGNAATANYFIGNGVYISNIAGANVSGTVANATYATSAGSTGSATTAGTVTTAAQPNITSVGSLTGLTVSNSTGIVDFTTTANVTLGAIANLHISGGTSGYVLQTDGTGNLSWTAQTGGGGGSGTPGGANTQLQFNDAGSFGGSAALTFNKTTNALSLSGNLTVTNANITSNISVGSGSGGNITGANIITANYFVGAGNALSNITAANITGTVANANYSAYAGVVTTAAQPNITSVGTLTNTTLGSSNSLTGGNLVSATYLTGTLTTAAQPNITSVGTLTNTTLGGANSLTGGNLVSANYITGTLTTAAQPNITSVGTLSSLTITANITSGNANLGNLATANYFTGNGALLTAVTGANITGTVANANYATYAGTVLTAAQPNITSVGTLSSLSVTGNLTSGNASLGNVASANIMNLGTGARPANVQTNSALFVVSNTAAASPPISIQNRFATGYSSIDVFNSSNVFMGAMGAANPSATSVPALGNAMYMYSESAGGVGLFANSANVSFSANGNANILVVTGTGANVSGTLNATGNIIGANANLGNIVIANYHSGNGSLLTGITGANVTGTVANATYATSAGSATTAGTLTTAAQPNITSVGTLSSLAVTANANVGNLYSSGQVNGVDAIFTGNLTVQGNTTYVNVDTFRVEDPVIELGGGPNGASLSTNDGKDRGTLLHYYTTAPVDAFMGWDNSNAEFGFGSNVSLSGDVVTWNTYGNVRASYFLGNGSQLTGTIANANYSVYSGIAYSVSGANVSGTVANATYADSAGSATSATSATTAGTVTTAAQPNITSVGTLTGFASNGTVNFANATNVTLGSTSTLHISGGTSGYVLQTDGAGNLSWTAQTGGGGGGSVGGANTEVQYNDSGSFAGSAAFTFNNASNTLTSANIVATANLTAANANLGNAVTANYFIGTFYGTANAATTATTAGTVTTAVQPNITSTGTLTSLTVSGLLTATSTGVKTANILDSTGTVAINTRYNSKAGSIGVYTDVTVGTSGTGNLTVNGNTNLGSNANVYISGGDPDYVLSTDGAGNLSWVAQTGGGGGGGSSIANGTSNVKIATSGGDITMTVNGTANVVTVASTGVTITGNTDLGANSNVLISGGTSGQVLATNGDGTLYWTTAGSSVVYQLDDLSSYTDGVLNTFMLAYNQSIVEITDPFGILVTINGATQPAWVWNTDTVWQNFTLSSQKGYTIITPGYLTFADPPPAGAEIMVRTVTGTTNPVPRRYPFMPGDIMLG
jgi:hypothetical protein